jgi:hypothetical protein
MQTMHPRDDGSAVDGKYFFCRVVYANHRLDMNSRDKSVTSALKWLFMTSFRPCSCRLLIICYFSQFDMGNSLHELSGMLRLAGLVVSNSSQAQ